MTQKEKHIQSFLQQIQKFKIDVVFKNNKYVFSHGHHQVEFLIADETFDFSKNYQIPVIPYDYLVVSPNKIASIILSHLNLNTRIFARKCEVKKISKPSAEDFLNKTHLMNATSSGYNLGLFYLDELVCVVSFTKGRKMNRLEAHLRSFELIRFCSKSGITVVGGLSKLLKTFFDEKGAGDIMTYVDKQFSDGKSFIKAGFKIHSYKSANQFLIHQKTFQRVLFQNQDYNSKEFYLTQNEGSIKLVYQPKQK